MTRNAEQLIVTMLLLFLVPTSLLRSVGRTLIDFGETALNRLARDIKEKRLNND
jgi:hypothetical protein